MRLLTARQKRSTLTWQDVYARAKEQQSLVAQQLAEVRAAVVQLTQKIGDSDSVAAVRPQRACRDATPHRVLRVFAMLSENVNVVQGSC